MDFFARQAQARAQTRWLVVAFAVAVLVVALAVDVVLFAVFASVATQDPTNAFQFMQHHPGSAVFCTFVVLGVIGVSSLFKAAQLRDGGSVVARMLGGTQISRDSQDPARKRLLNVVEEMAIASGVPMPEVFVLENEPSINAFAAGHTPANAAIAVTRGALDTLNRDELQGVIAHEFSHVLNGDMRLNVQLMGWLFGLFVVALIGRTILRYSPRGRRGAAALFAMALAIMVLGYIGLFFGRLLQAAVSRQRERLADASSVQFTRNPQGLKGALVKIAGVPEGSQITGADPEQAAHMLFAPGLKRFLQTHPPLAERIKELDPHFDVRKLPATAAVALKTIPAFDGSEVAGSHLAPAAAAAAASVPAEPQAIAAQVGQLQTIHIEHAKKVRLALPDSLRELGQSPARARTLVLALLLSRDDAVRERQLALLAKFTGADDLHSMREVFEVAKSLEPMLRLPALLQLFPALRRLPITERQLLARLADNLIRADARVDVFEFCLAHLLATFLRDEIEARAPHGKLALADAEPDIHVVFACLARFGAEDVRQARMAYEAGMQIVLPMHRPPWVEIENWVLRLGESLKRLEGLQPFAKKVLVEGLVKTVAHDGTLNTAEAELLRTVCAGLHCPLPPLLPGVLAARS